MTDPSYAIQKAVNAALTAIPGLKVYTRVPAGAKLPYVEIGGDQILGDDDAGSFFTAYVEVRSYAKTTGEVKTIAGKVYAALNGNLDLDGFTCHEFHFESTTYRTEVNGSDEVEQAITTFEYGVQTVV